MLFRTTFAALLGASLAFADDAPASATTPELAAEAAPVAAVSAAPLKATVVAKSADAPAAARPSAATNPPIKPGDSRCTEASQPGLTVEANTGSGQAVSRVRRVLRITADRRTMVCREFDRNGDGRFDTARHYDSKGDPTYEEIDSDHDGRIDLWLFFQQGKVGEEQRDTNLDGEADETITFNELGQISRIRRDRNFDGKTDEWEIYSNGSLERRGVDDSFEGRVTRWDRDGELVPPEPPAAEEKKEEAPPPAEPPASKKGAKAAKPAKKK
jgi:hypothetical protein